MKKKLYNTYLFVFLDVATLGVFRNQFTMALRIHIKLMRIRIQHKQTKNWIWVLLRIMTHSYFKCEKSSLILSYPSLTASQNVPGTRFCHEKTFPLIKNRAFTWTRIHIPNTDSDSRQLISCGSVCETLAFKSDLDPRSKAGFFQFKRIRIMFLCCTQCKVHTNHFGSRSF